MATDEHGRRFLAEDAVWVTERPGKNRWWLCRRRPHRWVPGMFGTQLTCARCGRRDYIATRRDSLR